jgi:phage tail sheath protein FI
MPTYSTPGMYFEAEDQGSAAITAIRTDIAAFLGIAEKGPVHQPTAVNSWVQFQSTFGNFIPNGYMAYCAKAFFENGGKTLYGVRVAAPEVNTATDPGVVQAADGMSSVLLDVQGFAAGALATAKQTAVAHAAGAQPAGRAASVVDTVSGFPQGAVVRMAQTVPAPAESFRRVMGVNAAANTLYWDVPMDAAFDLAQAIKFTGFQEHDLLIQAVNAATRTVTWAGSIAGSFNVAQPIEFASGAGAAHGTLYDAAGQATVRIEALTPGAWGDGISVLVTQPSRAAATTNGQPQPATGTASLLTSIVGFNVGTLVRAYQAGVAPEYHVVKAIDATMNLLMWDTPLGAPLNLAQTISFETVEFALTVLVNGMPQENFAGLSLDSRSANYVEAAVNAATSHYIRAADLHSTSPWPQKLPDPTAPQLNDGVLTLWGGRDGIAALTARDFMGDAGSESKWGLRTLEDIDEVSLVCAADILIEPSAAVMYEPQPPKAPEPCLPGMPPAITARTAPLPVEAAPTFTLDDVFQVQQALIAHCEVMQYRVALLDPPDFGYPRQRVDLGEIQAWRNRFDTKYAALYYPWVLVNDPLLLNGEIVRRIPPSGHAAGICAQTDTTVGVHKAPANLALEWAQDVTTEVTAEMQGFLNPLGVNCIRAFSGRGLRIYGARTLSSKTMWRFLNVRRLMCMIEHALEIALQWAVFEPNNFYLWHKVRLSAITFLTALWEKGALVGNTAADAFFVNCDQLTNPVAVTSNGWMVAEIGVAPTQPAEFVVLRIGRTENTLEVQEQT